MGGDLSKALDYMIEVGVTYGGKKSESKPMENVPADKEPLKLELCMNYWAEACSMKPDAPEAQKCKPDRAEFDPKTHCPQDGKCTAGDTTKLISERKAKKEILKRKGDKDAWGLHGNVNKHPVAALMDVYEDLFFNDGSSVYIHTSGRFLGKYWVKVLGRDQVTSNGPEYYIVKTTFGNDIGANGVIKVLRGDKHLGLGTEYFYADQVVTSLKTKSK
jgi:hypothetical protein